MDERPKYTIFLLRYWWLIVLATLLGTAAAFLVRTQQPSQYQAEARVIVGNITDLTNPDLSAIDAGARLAQTYAQLITFEMMSEIVSELQLTVSPVELQTLVSTATIQNTPILTVAATYPDPQLAAAIANSVAQKLIENSPANLTAEQEARMASLQTQITEIEGQIAISNQESLTTLANLNSATEAGNQPLITRYSADYARQVEQLNAARTILASLTDSFIELSMRASKIEILEQARAPERASGLNRFIVAGAGGVGGAIAAIALLLFISYLDTSIRTTKDVEIDLGQQPLGAVRSFQRMGRNPANFLVASTHFDQPIAEELKNIRTRLAAAHHLDGRLPCYVVSSVHPGEGKTMIAANIAALMAATGARVLLIDGNLRHPVLDKVFAIAPSPGLAELLELSSMGSVRELNKGTSSRKRTVDKAETEGADSAQDIKGKINASINSTAIKNLFVMPVGQYALSTIELIGSTRMNTLITWLAQEFDYLFIDSASADVFSDAAAIASAVRGQVILVMRSGRVQRDHAREIIDRFQSIDTPIAGVVVNGTKSTGASNAPIRYAVPVSAGKPPESATATPPAVTLVSSDED
jgi:Mrp family chromosome partitioning ATPase